MDAKKHLGQHWLKDENILKEIVASLEIKKNDTVVEIGPGKGALTKYLVQEPIELIAVEYDTEIIPNLKRKFAGAGLAVKNQDFLDFNLNDLPKDYKIVGNIPYYITGKIIEKCLSSQNKPSVIVLLIQKEVAERIAAKPGEMSILGVMSQFYADVKLGPVATADKFDPPPKVDSQVVILHPFTASAEPARNVREKVFERVVKAGFSAKRKKLHTAMAGGLHISVDEAKKILNNAGIDSNLRAQELSIEEWLKLAQVYEQARDL